MKRLTIVVLFGYGFAVGCFPSSYASHPELELTVVDGTGKAIAGAEVVSYSWSNPHHRLDHEEAHATDALGKVSTKGRSQSEWIAPFCLHGVAEHHMTICVSKPGFRSAQVELVDGTTPTTLLVKLTPDPAAAPCSYGAGRLGGRPRTDITGSNVDRAWEVAPAPSASPEASASPAAPAD